MPGISPFEINNPLKKDYNENVVENSHSLASLPHKGLGDNLGIEAAGPLVAALTRCGQGDGHAVFLQRRIESLVYNNDYSDKEGNISGSNSALATLKPDQRSLNQQLANNCAVIKNMSMSQGNNAPVACSSYDFTQNIKKLLLERTMVRKKIEYKIPKIAHYIWLGNPAKLTNFYIRNIINCAVLNPDYKVKLWVDNAEKMKTYLINERYSSAFFKKIEILTLCLPSDIASAVARECTHTRYKNYAAASDIIRLSLLKDYGGIYMDVDVARQEPLGNLIPFRKGSDKNMDTLFHLEYHNKAQGNKHIHAFSNGVIASVKNSKTIIELLEIALIKYGGIKSELAKRSARLFGMLLKYSPFGPMGSPFFRRIMHVTVPGFTEYMKAKEAEDFIWRKKRIEGPNRLNGTMRTTGPVMITRYLVNKHGYLFDRFENRDSEGEDILSSMMLSNITDFGQIKSVGQFIKSNDNYDAKRLYNLDQIFGIWMPNLNCSAGWLATDNTLTAAEI